MNDDNTPPAAPVRLEDIAKAVGISRSEVSRVLNNRVRAGRGIRGEKQEEIRRLASAWGYVPNRAARNLVRGRTDFVGMPIQVGPDRQLAPHYHEIVGALTATLSRHGLHLVLVDVREDTVEPLMRFARARSVDAFLLTDIQVDDPRPALLQAMGIPFVVRGTSPLPGTAAVGMHNARVGQMAVEHLVAHGHRRILFHNVGRELMAGLGRWNGYREAVATRGIETESEYVDHVWREEDVHRFALEALSARNRPTAVHAGDEVAAAAFLRAAQDLGLRVPEDLSLCTCLNARFMRRVLPQIDAIDIRQGQIATAAGELLAQVLREPQVPREQQWIEPVLEARGSVVAPNA
jgi:DNA-binding LacI/PurR family transcriptional regulator